MKHMTPAELHKLLTEAVIGAHQELSSVASHDNPHVRRAYELLTSTMDRVIFAAHQANPDRSDISAAVGTAHHSRGESDACGCDCHADRQGRREWPLMTDSLGEITACSLCRDEHRRLMPPQDTAA
jgi:hypothetical protein